LDSALGRVQFPGRHREVGVAPGSVVAAQAVPPRTRCGGPGSAQDDITALTRIAGGNYSLLSCSSWRRQSSWRTSAGRSRQSRCTLTYSSRKIFTDRKSTRLNSSHVKISYAVFCLKKKNPVV